MRRLVPSAVLLLGFVHGTVSAEDAAPTPARRAADVRAAFPAPVAEAGFTFEADILVAGEARRRGTATYAARPAAGVAGVAGAGWEVSEVAEVPDANLGQVRRQETKALLGRDLRLRTYDRTVSTPAGVLNRTRASWLPDNRLNVVRTDDQGAETSASAPADPSATATLAGLVLFLRLCPAAPAAYEMPIFVHETGAVRTVRVEVAAPAAKDPSAESILTASLTMGEWRFSIQVAEKGRAPRRIEQWTGATHVIFAPRSATPEGPVDPSKPAATAREPGVRFLVGLLTGDEGLVASAFHWPSLLAAEKAKSGFEGDETALRKDVLAKLKATYQSTPRAEAESRARAAAAAATEAEEGGRVLVRFGEPLPKLAYWAKSVDGAWFVVEMLPGR